ncbi:MAG: MEMO1 family protein [Patescibacteria group bacterium]|nr:MEMO1 family protein [Patescibacteria group bacterium]
MSLVFSSICPHPPIIIPTIGQENLSAVKKTIKGLEKLEKDFSRVKPETVIVISPHGVIYADSFSLNFSENYSGNFQSFGDFTTNLNFNPDLEFLHHLKEKIEEKLPVVLVSEKNLDHGSLVPLYYLTKNHQPKIIPIGYSFLDFETHLELGKILKEEISASRKKIGVIASGDLSHRVTPEAPAGYSPKGGIFDKRLITLLKNKNLKGILEMDKNLIEEAGECGLRSFLILLGILEKINYKPEVYSYEAPFGVGYLVMNFRL